MHRRTAVHSNMHTARGSLDESKGERPPFATPYRHEAGTPRLRDRRSNTPPNQTPPPASRSSRPIPEPRFRPPASRESGHWLVGNGLVAAPPPALRPAANRKPEPQEWRGRVPSRQVWHKPPGEPGNVFRPWHRGRCAEHRGVPFSRRTVSGGKPQRGPLHLRPGVAPISGKPELVASSRHRGVLPSKSTSPSSGKPANEAGPRARGTTSNTRTRPDPPANRLVRPRLDAAGCGVLPSVASRCSPASRRAWRRTSCRTGGCKGRQLRCSANRGAALPPVEAASASCPRAAPVLRRAGAQERAHRGSHEPLRAGVGSSGRRTDRRSASRSAMTRYPTIERRSHPCGEPKGATHPDGLSSASRSHVLVSNPRQADGQIRVRSRGLGVLSPRTGPSARKTARGARSRRDRLGVLLPEPRFLSSGEPECSDADRCGSWAPRLSERRARSRAAPGPSELDPAPR